MAFIWIATHFVQHGKQLYLNVLHSSFHLNGHMLGFHLQTWKLELLSRQLSYDHTSMVLTSKSTYKNMTTISVFLATSSRDASDSRNTCSDSLYRADAVAYPPACQTTHITKRVTSVRQGKNPSPRRDSDPQPSTYWSGALTTELHFPSQFV